MYCCNCGKEVSSKDMYCYNCGAKILEKKSSSKDTLIKVLAALFVVAVIALAAWYVKKIVMDDNRTKPIIQDSKEEILPSVYIPEDIEKNVQEEAEDLLAENADFIGDLGRNDEVASKLVKRLIEYKKIDENKILSVCCSDFDGNNENEAFIFAGENIIDEYSNYYAGTFWYVDETKIEELDNPYMNYDEEIITWLDCGRFVDFGNRKYFVITSNDGFDCNSDVWTIKNNEIEMEIIPGIGSFEVYPDGLCVKYVTIFNTQYSYEMGYEGRTSLPYYYYYDAQRDSFVEYGAKEIDIYDLNAVCGTDMIEKIEDVGRYIFSAYELDNSLVIINYIKYDYYDDEMIYLCNATWDKKLKSFINANSIREKGTFEDSNFRGFYDCMNSEKESAMSSKRLMFNLYGDDYVLYDTQSLIMFGDDCGSEIRNRAFVVDMDTQVVENTNGKNAVEFINYLRMLPEDYTQDGIVGAYIIEVTGSHVDTIINRGWWD